MPFLKALGAGLGTVGSQLLFTVVYGFIAANLQGPTVKAIGMIVVLASPYYWTLMILLVALEAWFLMRSTAI